MEREDNFKEYRQFFILSAFLAVFPLVFFPKSIGFELKPLLLFPLELGWYILIYVLLFPFLSFPMVALYSFFSLLLRVAISIIFGVLISLMFSLSFFSSLKSGIATYLPSILFQLVLLPLLFKFSFGEKIVKHERDKKMERSRHIPEVRDEVVPLHPKTEPQEGTLENALSYLKEYSGVEGAFLIDSEGLLLGETCEEGLDGEKVAPLALSLEDINSNLLKKLGESKIERIQLFTPKRWINLNRILNFTLVTIASRNTDELLNIRIMKSAEMLKKFLKEKYGKLLGSEEGRNVSDLRGA